MIEEVNALSWVSDSATDLLVATEDSMVIWDIRMMYQIKNPIDQNLNKPIFSIKFDPFDKNRFAVMSEDMVKIYDLRILQKP